MIAAASPPAKGSQPIVRCRPSGIMPARVNSPCSRCATRTPIGAATTNARSEMSRASPATMRRTCRGVLPIARKSASSRWRCWTESAKVLETTKIAMKAARTPKTVSPATMSSRLNASSGDSASPRFAPVSTRSAGWSRVARTRRATVSMSAPGRVTIPSRSTRSPVPPRPAATSSLKKTAAWS